MVRRFAASWRFGWGKHASEASEFERGLRERRMPRSRGKATRRLVSFCTVAGTQGGGERLSWQHKLHNVFVVCVRTCRGSFACFPIFFLVGGFLFSVRF